MNQSQLAKRVGYHRSTISMLLKGKLANIDDDLVDLINDALDANIAPISRDIALVSSTAFELSALAKENKPLAEILESLLDLAKVSGEEIQAFLPQVETKRLPKIGAEITKIVMRWEEGTDPHYSKIAVEVLDFLRAFYVKAAKS